MDIDGQSDQEYEISHSGGNESRWLRHQYRGLLISTEGTKNMLLSL